MSLPLDLVLVRHGQSEGNAAKRLSEAGDHSAMTEVFLNRHSADLCLTELGRTQALQTGRFILQEFFKQSIGFDRYITSNYNRAMETAGTLHLPNADWLCDFYLTERDWGSLESCPENERGVKFDDALRSQKIEPFFWRPPNGESFADLCLRVDRVLATLHRECSDKRVIIVCHGEVMRAFQVRIERMSKQRFRELTFSAENSDRIFNCQILHYTRRSPESGIIAPHANWVRWIRPTESPVVISPWQTIMRPRYGNSDLLDIVRKGRSTK